MRGKRLPRRPTKGGCETEQPRLSVPHRNRHIYACHIYLFGRSAIQFCRRAGPQEQLLQIRRRPMMAQGNPMVPARQDDTDARINTESREWEIVGGRESQRAPSLESDSLSKARETLASAVASAKRSFDASRQEISHALDNSFARVRKFAEDRPLHLLAIIAGTAFAAGMALRIWRSSRYGRA